ncbi:MULTISPECIES: glycoside hydrolase family 1 protein [unclassified Microbacterium]|uniref:glycoside hydrolase family 1 protein n=1 Tax=unclassified Microbacterium TaxID=2609290 RepID=UPI002469AAFB|nr:MULTISPECIES: family 1 glycosylhydrolase [unclassified Microbacterium]MDH5132219.1 family 1 glycosylhydrolase [Microbacterium sp. RD10]MDH5135482.1 family 1 glycosylhydrolase [Microbacterium sp. RD11]MDH5143612.1 family 1 glycosylhydrolase [Microbacterium sp. RD12]MDH5154260.1 family 1 glycosylhydrolase [Microbacterium sp. RD06]MDH5164572.1 family 1 glycosylhydrolase [Microbacterium sp. RD02]
MTPLSTDPTARARLRWSAATSSVQIEGSRRADGAGRSIWDDEIAKPGRIRDGSTAEPACDSYRRVEDDVALAAGLGLDRYRFSIPWARVQSDGHGPGNIAALDHYARVVDGLLAAGVTPFPTLYHWELPSAVEADGGWLARDTAERFGEYAALVAARLGDRVSSWYTLNEPAMTTLQGYAVGALAPGRQLLFGALPTVHHQLLAHSRAAEALHARGAASVGLVNNHTWVLPLRDTEEDRTAAAVYDLLHNRLFSEPLLSGTSPHLEALGLPPLPILGDDLARIAGSIDFYGVNFYNPTTVTAGAPDADIPFEIVPTPGVPVTGFGPEWPIMPSALRDLLIDLHRRHPDMPPIIIGENGASFPEPDVAGAVEDADRIAYLSTHIDAVGEALDAGVPVEEYTVWSLLDNWEWTDGYTQRFGLVHVDFSSGERTPKASYGWYRDLVAGAREARDAAAARA